MRETHPVFDREIDVDAPVWRYFDFAKFTAFLQQRALYFSRADLLGDPLEGSLTYAYAAQRAEMIRNPPGGRTSELQQEIFRHNERISSMDPKTIYVSCWHLGDHESMAMWRVYGDGPYGVALRSTFGHLDQAILEKFEASLREETIHIGRVKYIDHASLTEHLPHEFNVYGRLMCKSVAYRHENELRAMFWDCTAHLKDEPEKGYVVPIDFLKLAPSVVISPLSPNWFRDVVASLCTAYDVAWELTGSIAAVNPVY